MPSGSIKLKYSCKEDGNFINNPDISFYKSEYKQYDTFSKVPIKIEGEDNFNINSNITYEYELNISTYDYLGPIYLYLNLSTPISNNILDFIDKIELYCSTILLDNLNPDIIKLYNNLLQSPSESKINKIISDSSKRNIYYIPICFPFLKDPAKYIPLYQLYNDNITLKITFKEVLQNDVIAFENNIIGHYCKIQNIDIYKTPVKYWFIEKTDYMKNIIVRSSVNGDIANKIDLKPFKKLCKSLIIVLKKSNIDFINITMDDVKLTYTKEELAFTRLLQTNLNYNNNYTSDYTILLYNFSLFDKDNVSGYINLFKVNKFNLEFYPYFKHTELKFNIIQSFDLFYFDVTTDLQKIDSQRSPTIVIYTNVKYNLSQLNCDIIITTSNPQEFINNNIDIPEDLYFSGFNDIEKTFIIDNIETYTTLYYCDKTEKITAGKFEVKSDNKAFAGDGILDIYTINYDMYFTEFGKLFYYNFY